ncbi:hypothetical protein HDU98_004107 [Podochytrium sp. JEL0797]|nr:hypothetical protein HDU98_004107 [Podochytrium sp. JEL0797]
MPTDPPQTTFLDLLLTPFSQHHNAPLSHQRIPKLCIRDAMLLKRNQCASPLRNCLVAVDEGEDAGQEGAFSIMAGVSQATAASASVASIISQETPRPLILSTAKTSQYPQSRSKRPRMCEDQVDIDFESRIITESELIDHAAGPPSKRVCFSLDRGEGVQKSVGLEEIDMAPGSQQSGGVDSDHADEDGGSDGAHAEAEAGAARSASGSSAGSAGDWDLAGVALEEQRQWRAVKTPRTGPGIPDAVLPPAQPHPPPTNTDPSNPHTPIAVCSFNTSLVADLDRSRSANAANSATQTTRSPRSSRAFENNLAARAERILDFCRSIHVVMLQEVCVFNVPVIKNAINTLAFYFQSTGGLWVAHSRVDQWADGQDGNGK